MRRLTPIVAAVLALSFAPHAQAADAFSAPTLSYSVVGPGGVSMPKSLVKAQWTVGTPGKLGTLYVDARNVPGTTTTIDALWTSKDVKVYKDIPAFVYDIDNTHSNGGGFPSSVSWGLRWRTAGGSYNNWYDIQYPYGPVLDEVKREIQVAFPKDMTKKMQFQLRVHVSLSDAGEEKENWKVHVNN